MRYNRLGRTGLFVSEFCLGTMTFGHAAGRYAAASGVDQEVVDAILRRAIDAGVNFIDTANVYAEGQAEEIVGRALKSLGISRKGVRPWMKSWNAEHAFRLDLLQPPLHERFIHLHGQARLRLPLDVIGQAEVRKHIWSSRA